LFLEEQMEEIIKRCKATNGILYKQEILLDTAKRYPELKDLLYRAYEPFVQYHMMSKIDLRDSGSRTASEMWEEFTGILDIMENSATPQKNREMLIPFLGQCNKDTQELFLGVVRKNLKLGFGIKQINKVFSGLVTTFDVMLAGRYDPDKQYSVKQWKASAKMDGLRLVSLYGFPNPGWTIYTRTGKDITSRMPHLLPDLEAFRLKYGFSFLDGEGYNHGATFEELQSDVLRHGGEDCSHVEYHTFAFGDVKSFLNQSGTGIIIPSSDTVRIGNIVTVSHYKIPNIPKRMEQFAMKMEEQGYEGGCFRNPAFPYAHGRTNNLIKLKSWLLDTEQEPLAVKCVDIEGSEQRRADTATGGMIEVETMKSIAIEDPDTGIITRIGSGFSHDQRDEIWKNKDKYIGKMMDIKFQKEGSRGAKIFPIFVRWREDL